MAATPSPGHVAEPLRPAGVIGRSSRYLERHGVDSPRETAETLLMWVLGTDRAGLYARREGLSTAEARRFGRALCQRCTGVPLQHLTGEQSFMDLLLRVEPGVFVPRPETEGLVEEALRLLEGRSDPVVVDAGTGTGAIALAIKRYRPDATVVATDMSLPAVSLAKTNADRMGLEVDVRRGDLLDPVPDLMRGAVDLVVSNPPYVTAEQYDSLPREVKAEPFEALVGGTQVHRRLVSAAMAWVRPGGWLLVEIGDDQGPEVAGQFAGTLEDVLVLQDLGGRDRMVRGRRPRRS